ncbi:MAG: ABC transporter permease [Clostridia bacterium]|nr:ABC transporter permease [Clostridia bacterium]
MRKRAVQRIVGSFAVFAISAVLCFGLLLYADDSEAVNGLKTLLLSAFSSEEGIQITLMYWPILILTGLSVGAAWKTGLINLGVPGQMLIGALLARLGALRLALPWWACLTLAALGGALWSAMTGAVNNRFRLRAVLSAMTLNFIALYLARWAKEEWLGGLNENASQAGAALPALRIRDGFSVSIALPVTLILCLAIWIVIRFTVFGFEMKTGASNPEAAKRAGMPTKRNVTLELFLSGAFSGLAGGICLLSGLLDASLETASSLLGFTGIPVAMLSFGHPLGTLVTAFAAANIWTGSEALPAVYPREAGMALLAAALLGSAVLHRKQR